MINSHSNIDGSIDSKLTCHKKVLFESNSII